MSNAPTDLFARRRERFFGEPLERGEVDAREHRVTALADGVFEYEGRRYKSLSAIATEIAGTRWNGFLFFGLKKRGESTREESAA